MYHAFILYKSKVILPLIFNSILMWLSLAWCMVSGEVNTWLVMFSWDVNAWIDTSTLPVSRSCCSPRRSWTLHQSMSCLRICSIHTRYSAVPRRPPLSSQTSVSPFSISPCYKVPLIQRSSHSLLVYWSGLFRKDPYS